VRVLPGWPQRTTARWLFTFAPSTPLLMPRCITVGRLFPRGDRAPAIEPVAEKRAAPADRAATGLRAWHAWAHRACPAASTPRRPWSWCADENA
jgi:magnesium-protoporphyrin O-methyltransferase